MASTAELAGLASKITQMLNVTTARGATEEEAANAAAMVQRLLLKHNLTMAEVATETGGQTAAFANNVVVIGQRHGVLNWRRDLICGLGLLNFCKPLAWSGATYINLIGTPANIDATVQMFAYLVATIERISMDGWRACLADNGGKAPMVMSWRGYMVPLHQKRYRASFSTGAVRRVLARLHAERDAQARDDSAVNALVIVNDEQLGKATVQHYPHLADWVAGKTRGTARKTDLDSQALLDGIEAGGRISFNKHLTD